MNTKTLRSFAISQTLFPQTSLDHALQRLQFVQADPIRSPARAQDLILRHRVQNYLAGDLEKKYSTLEIEEDYLYAYGFLHRNISKLWDPRKAEKLSAFDKKVLEFVNSVEQVDPNRLDKHVGGKKARNWWGGKSKAATLSLDILQYHGLIRVKGRNNGKRIYARKIIDAHPFSETERKKNIIITVVHILQPVTEKKLNEALHYTRRMLGETKSVIESLVKSGELITQKIDGVRYIWAKYMVNEGYIDNTVRFLAPFDPLVWDRNRFEHIWGWQYRFEAYTPKVKRIRGYYAMPVLWQDTIIGWANISKKDKDVSVDLGFVHGRPKSKKFEKELKEEIERLKIFLQ